MKRSQEWKVGRIEDLRNGKFEGVRLPGMESWKECGSQEWIVGTSEAPRNGKVERVRLPGMESW